MRELDRGSATRRAAIGEAKDWGVVEHLLAELIDAVQVWGWAQVGNKKNPRPDPVPRPGGGVSSSAASELIARLRAQQRRRR